MKILCFGDSNTWGYDPRGYWGGRYESPWPEILAEKLGCEVLNRGENGREIPVAPVWEEADILIIMLGTNDLLQGGMPETICGKMERFLSPIDPRAVILIAPPALKRGTWVDNQTLIDDSRSLALYYRNLALGMGIRFADAQQWNVPLAFDGVHFTENGHRIFADELFHIISEINGG